MSSFNFLNSLCNLFHPFLNLITGGSGGGSASTGVTDLPLSVIIEIILKLPIKSIIRSRCVCKSWYNLTLDPYFTSSYFANPPFTAIVLSQHRIVDYGLGDESFVFLEIGRNGDVMRTPFNPKPLNFHRSGFLSIMGSCDGLLCMVQTPTLERGSYGRNHDSTFNNQTVYIINPLLGEFTMLPRAKRAKNTRNVVYCLGCNRISDSYKALRISSSCVDGGHGYQVDFEILTVGVDVKWRSLDLAFATSLFPCGICLNGAIHLVGGESPFGFILAFDIEEENGHCFSLPRGLGDEPSNIVLAVWDDKLCFADNVEGRVDIWTMKQYGDLESWSRDIILKSWIPFDLRPYRLIPIATLRNGDLLMARMNEGDITKPHPNHLMSFNPKTETCTKHEISGGGEVVVPFFHGYVPRFFS